MEEKDTKVNFDMSKLTLPELIKTYEDINAFLDFLKSKRIEDEGDKNE